MRSANRFSGHATNDRGGLILAALSLLSLLAGPSTVLRAQEPLSPPSSQVSSQVSSQTASPIAAHPIVPQLLSYTGVAANRAGDRDRVGRARGQERAAGRREREGDVIARQA